ncbi:MAG: hypothetical protein P8010_26660, partial [Desulfosarcinaceae bacterium]
MDAPIQHHETTMRKVVTGIGLSLIGALALFSYCFVFLRVSCYWHYILPIAFGGLLGSILWIWNL